MFSAPARPEALSAVLFYLTAYTVSNALRGLLWQGVRVQRGVPRCGPTARSVAWPTRGFLTLRYQRRMAESSGALAGLVLEYLRGVAKLRVTGAEARAFANWARKFSRMKQLAFGASHVKNVNDVFLSVYGG